jgi:hypothetical protein
MAKSLETLQSEYETALAAEQDNPDDEKKRQAAARASDRLTAARTAARADRGGIGVVAADDGEGD